MITVFSSAVRTRSIWFASAALLTLAAFSTPPA